MTSASRHRSIWLECQHPGCPNGIRADSAHRWDCGNHPPEVPC